MPEDFIQHLRWEKRILNQEAVALWFLQDAPAFDPETALTILSPSEQSRAAHFKAPGKRREYILGRWFIRHALAQYLQVPPADFNIQWQPGEKPWLKGHGTWTFNLSHSHGAMVCLISPQYPVGVDIEYLGRRVLNLQYDHAFTSLEQEEHTSHPEAKQRFFLRWTLKEALWKGINSPIYIPFNGFEIRFDPLEVIGNVPEWPDHPRDFRWVTPAPGYLVAADIEGVEPGKLDWQFHTFAFPTDTPTS